MHRVVKRNILRVALLSLLGLLLAGCTLSEGAMPTMDMPQKPAASETKETVKPVPNQVVIENFSFVPATLTIKAGTKVTWVNRDDVPHTATDNDKRFNSKALDTDDQFAFTFSEPGTYNYFCALHPKMIGQIIVK